MSPSRTPSTHVWAIVRYDAEMSEPEHQFTVKEVVHDPEIARLEAERLNRVGADRGSRYFVQLTRLFAPGTSAGTRREADVQSDSAADDVPAGPDRSPS